MSVQDAFYRTVHGAPGGAEALAPRLGMSAGVLRNKANPNAPGNTPSLEDADKIIGLTGDAQVLEAMALNHGYVLVRLHDEATACDHAVLELVAKVWARQGDVGAEILAALEDGRVEQHEMKRVRLAVNRAMQALLEVQHRFEGMAEK